MTDSRWARVWNLIAAHAAGRGGRASVQDVCGTAVQVTEVSGAWLVGAGGASVHVAMQATDVVSERLAELQVTVGEGPCADALASGAPVLVPDLRDADGRWPVFGGQARRVGAGAVFAFPLAVGAIWLGVLGLYRGTPGSLTRAQFGDALVVADAATVLLLEHQGDGGSPRPDGAQPGGQSPDLAVHRAEIDQATGMLTMQLDVTATEAFIRLRAYAYSRDRRLADVARDIVARRLRLDADPDGQR